MKHNQLSRVLCILPIVVVSVFLGFRAVSLLLAKNIVELRDDGFYPYELTVHEGETVTFHTTRKKAFWPASDPHPAHTNYPDFDSGKPIPRGTKWSFTFRSIGEWEYHNHLGSNYSPDNGIIRVVEKSKPLSMPKVIQRADDCIMKNNEKRRRCWEKMFQYLLQRRGVDETFNVLADLYDRDSFFASNCNDMTHKIGGLAAGMYGSSASVVIKPKSLYCNAGFYHGFMEVFMNQGRSLSEGKKFCQSVHETLGNQSPLATIACFHGLGHGSMEQLGIHDVTDWQTIFGILAKGFSLCRESTASKEYEGACINGMFNSTQMHYYASPFKPSEFEGNPFWLCAGVGSDYQLSCYEGMASNLMWGGKEDFAVAVGSIMKNVPEPYRESAFKSIVTERAFANVAKSDYTDEIHLCDTLSLSYQQSCRTNFLYGVIDNGLPGKEYENGMLFCASLGLENPRYKTCMKEAIDYVLKLYTHGNPKNVCDHFPGEYRTYCMNPVHE